MQIREKIVDFVVDNYLFGDSARLPSDHESLVDQGVVDSTGVLELVEFLEEQFGIEVLETETVPDNLGSIANLTKYVEGKKAASGLAR